MTRTRDQGSILLETLVALTLLAVSLLLTMALFAQEPAVVRRLDAHLEVLTVLDLTHERIRSGMTLPTNGTEPLDWRQFDPAPTVERAGDLRLWVEVGEGPVRDLRRVGVLARYRVGGRDYERRLETLVATQ